MSLRSLLLRGGMILLVFIGYNFVCYAQADPKAKPQTDVPNTLLLRFHPPGYEQTKSVDIKTKSVDIVYSSEKAVNFVLGQRVGSSDNWTFNFGDTFVQSPMKVRYTFSSSGYSTWPSACFLSLNPVSKETYDHLTKDPKASSTVCTSAANDVTFSNQVWEKVCKPIGLVSVDHLINGDRLAGKRFLSNNYYPYVVDIKFYSK